MQKCVFPYVWNTLAPVKVISIIANRWGEIGLRGLWAFHVLSGLRPKPFPQIYQKYSSFLRYLRCCKQNSDHTTNIRTLQVRSVHNGHGITSHLSGGHSWSMWCHSLSPCSSLPTNLPPPSSHSSKGGISWSVSSPSPPARHPLH